MPLAEGPVQNSLTGQSLLTLSAAWIRVKRQEGDSLRATQGIAQSPEQAPGDTTFLMGGVTSSRPNVGPSKLTAGSALTQSATLGELHSPPPATGRKAHHVVERSGFRILILITA